MLGLLNLGFSGHIGISTRYEVRNIKRGVSVFLCALCELRDLKTADNLQPGLYALIHRLFDDVGK